MEDIEIARNTKLEELTRRMLEVQKANENAEKNKTNSNNQDSKNTGKKNDK